MSHRGFDADLAKRTAEEYERLFVPVIGSVDEQSRTALERGFVERCQPFVRDGKMAGAVQMIIVLGTK